MPEVACSDSRHRARSRRAWRPRRRSVGLEVLWVEGRNALHRRFSRGPTDRASAATNSADRQRWSREARRQNGTIAKILADTDSGLTGSEIGYLLADCRIPDPDPEMTWIRGAVSLVHAGFRFPMLDRAGVRPLGAAGVAGPQLAVRRPELSEIACAHHHAGGLLELAVALSAVGHRDRRRAGHR